MIQSCRTFAAALLALSLAGAVAPSVADESRHAKAKLLHFGNMGGLMPTLQQKDLPEPESEAAELVFKMCGQCHNPPGPGLHTVKEWETVFWRMYWRMHLMNAQFEHFMVPTYGEGELMFVYLKKHAMRSVPMSKINLADEGAQDYVTYCGQCHQLPNPGMHPAGEWSKVIERMTGHMKSMSKNIPSKDEAKRINSYLSGASEK